MIYLALLFSIEFFNIKLLLLTTIGLISLCLMSSTNYIINDIIDRKKDTQHPEKKYRPIASGKISIELAFLIALLLFIISSYIAYKLSILFLFRCLAHQTRIVK